jgi:hypothetical protein
MCSYVDQIHFLLIFISGLIIYDDEVLIYLQCPSVTGVNLSPHTQGLMTLSMPVEFSVCTGTSK